MLPNRIGDTFPQIRRKNLQKPSKTIWKPLKTGQNQTESLRTLEDNPMPSKNRLERAIAPKYEEELLKTGETPLKPLKTSETHPEPFNISHTEPFQKNSKNIRKLMKTRQNLVKPSRTP